MVNGLATWTVVGATIFLASGLAAASWASIVDLEATPPASSPAAETARRERTRPPDSRFDPFVLNRNLFRASRRPPSIAFDPSKPLVTSAATTVSPQLVGVVLGPRPSAVLKGVPGVAGTSVVSIEEPVGVYRLLVVSADSAVLGSPADTLVLRLKEGPP
ncbi:MAG: hypothetical protein HY700_09855 [Gemmatimonadetes bacterium]|nr:hypothetical protein [Gemmatimonadota bacterium]